MGQFPFPYEVQNEQDSMKSDLTFRLLNNYQFSDMCLKVAFLNCHTVGFPLCIQGTKPASKLQASH